jgi:hypothetical protein
MKKPKEIRISIISLQLKENEILIKINETNLTYTEKIKYYTQLSSISIKISELERVLN